MAKNERHKKSTALAVQDRTNDVFNLLLLGADRARIRRFAAEKGWEISDRQIDRYIAKANEQFKEMNGRDRDLAFGKAASRLEHLYSKAMQSADSRQALAVERTIIDLYGLCDTELDSLLKRVELLEKIRMKL